VIPSASLTGRSTWRRVAPDGLSPLVMEVKSVLSANSSSRVRLNGPMLPSLSSGLKALR
jgi:hypothetical protein